MESQITDMVVILMNSMILKYLRIVSQPFSTWKDCWSSWLLRLVHMFKADIRSTVLCMHTVTHWFKNSVSRNIPLWHKHGHWHFECQPFHSFWIMDYQCSFWELNVILLTDTTPLTFSFSYKLNHFIDDSN